MSGVHVLSEWENYIIHQTCSNLKAAVSDLFYLFFFFFREVRWSACREDALLCHAHTQLWMAVHVACVMDATLTDETVSVESDFHILEITVSSAPV